MATTTGSARANSKSSNERKSRQGELPEAQKSRAPVEQKTADRVARSLPKALAHPLRIHILAAAHPGPTSPSEIAKRFGEDLPKVAYHFKELVKYEAIELVGEEKVRGAMKHLYVGTKRAVYTEADWLELPESVQIGLTHAGLRDFSDVVIAAAETGSLSTRDFVFDWKEHTLDEKGYQAMLQVEKLAIQKIARIEEESETRMVASGEKPLSTITGFFGFLAPPMKLPPNDDRDSDGS